MKIAEVDLLPYRLALSRPLPGDATGAAERHGFVLALVSEDGDVGWGDVAPLPGFSRETLEEARQEACDLAPALRALPPFVPCRLWADALFPPLAELRLSPSVRFGVETALCNLAAQAWQAPWHVCLTGRHASPLPVNALLSAASPEVATEAADAVACGYRFLKIKVGAGDPADDAACLRRLRDAVGAEVALRVDANRRWTLEQAFAFAEGVAASAIDYIEEPVARSEDLAAFMAKSGLPVALDESLDDVASVPEGLAAVVIKPALRGGINAALRLAEAARAAGAVPVISAAFESGLGIRALVQLASALGNGDAPVGVDTYRWLKQDVLRDPLPIRAGMVDVDDMGSRAVRLVRL